MTRSRTGIQMMKQESVPEILLTLKWPSRLARADAVRTTWKDPASGEKQASVGDRWMRRGFSARLDDDRAELKCPKGSSNASRLHYVGAMRAPPRPGLETGTASFDSIRDRC